MKYEPLRARKAHKPRRNFTRSRGLESLLDSAVKSHQIRSCGGKVHLSSTEPAVEPAAKAVESSEGCGACPASYRLALEVRAQPPIDWRRTTMFHHWPSVDNCPDPVVFSPATIWTGARFKVSKRQALLGRPAHWDEDGYPTGRVADAYDCRRCGAPVRPDARLRAVKNHQLNCEAPRTSNGRVGAFLGSFLGISFWLAATLIPFVFLGLIGFLGATITEGLITRSFRQIKREVRTTYNLLAHADGYSKIATRARKAL